jgi:hypothetical protein
MATFSCSECAAIYRDLKEAAAARSAQGVPPQDLIAWLSRLDEEDCTRIREDSPLWKTWRRMRAHRALTGHYVPLALPPDAISNWN